MAQDLRIVVQNIAQIKEKYDKLFESIIGGCDTIVFLGSSENETCKYISDTLGETTVRTRNISLSHGQKSGKSIEKAMKEDTGSMADSTFMF